MLQAYKVSRVIPLSESVVRYLTKDEFIENESAFKSRTIGGILSNTNFTWYANGPRLEVVSSKTGVKIAAWTFGSVLKDTSTKVVCVEEIPAFNTDLPILVVGLECLLTGGSICVFDLVNSKVLRVIQIKEKVTSIHIVNSGSDIFSSLGPLGTFDGVIAVGTAGGNVFLVDLCQHLIEEARCANNAHEIKDELDACELTILTVNDIGRIEYHKQRAVRYGNHLAIHLNAIVNGTSPHFVLKGPKGEDRIHVNKSEVTVSAIHYSPQLGSVLIGYNFGALQIWNIINMTLIYTSPVYEENIPVSHFAVQEPTDDPRIFCYVWAVYSSTEPYQLSFPVAVLYALNFECKDWHDGYGYLYEGLQSCTIRFQTELSLPHSSTDSRAPRGGHCLRLHTFNKGCVSRSSMSETHEDTLTVCSVVWNVWCTDKSVYTFLSIFDLNQWYKEQLPSLPDPAKYKSYMSYVCLSDLVNSSVSESLPILDANINGTTINQFIGVQRLEEHYYPTTLAFECYTCSENHIVHICNQGQQRALLTFVETMGSLILLKPVELFEESIKLGLTPLFTELPQVITTNFQREHLLSMILEQQMVGWLCKCVSAWSNGSYISLGCSLDFFLTWAWNRATVLKANTDKLCVPLFDYSGVKMDANSQRILNNSYKQLSNLNIIYEFVCMKLTPFLPSPDIVRKQHNSILIISVYLEVLQWMLNVRLLPEYHISSYKDCEQLDSIGAPYPIDCLLEYYNERRAYLQTLKKGKSSSNSSLLFIDNLIDFECGGVHLHNYWENDGGNGLYPPQSLQALLFTYLVEGVDLTYKHCVVIYVFLDLAMALDQERYKIVITHLIKFPAVFKLSSSIIKITQAFWQLDHGDFGTAMELLLDANICAGDLKMWHHRVVLNALLVQEQYNFALLYLQVRRPPLIDLEDLYTAITLFISNNMMDEAFYYQRQNSTQDNETLLLRHIFEECNKNNQINELISYKLSNKEEGALMKYLQEVNHPESEEFQVLYYLHQSRYMDIFHLQDCKKSGQLGLAGQRETNYKDEVTKFLSSFFPKDSRDLINDCRSEKPSLQQKVARPKPMSVVIHNKKEQIKYKSMLMHGAAKARETWSHSVLNDKLSNDEIPFLRTPTATPTRFTPGVSIISQKLVSPDFNDLDSGPSPSKKLKLSPRQSVGSTSMMTNPFLTVSCLTHLTRLDTPVVKRKVSRTLDFFNTEEKHNVCTPQSILKVRSLMSQSSQSSTDSTPKTVPTLLGVINKDTSKTSTLSRGLRITPRKSLLRSVVRFEKRNESSLTETTDSVKTYLDVSGISSLSKLSDEVTRKSDQDTTKNSSQSTDVYYSPESSFNSAELNSLSDSNRTSVTRLKTEVVASAINVETSELDVERDTKPGKPDGVPTITVSFVDVNGESTDAYEISRDELISSLPDVQINTTPDLQSVQSDGKEQKFPTSPRSRRSYRDDSTNEIQTRSRSRQSLHQEEQDSHADESPKEKLMHQKSKLSAVRVGGRKSLSRHVLENNAFSAMLSSFNKSVKSDPVHTYLTVEKHSTSTKEVTVRSTALDESASGYPKHSSIDSSKSIKATDTEGTELSCIEHNLSSISKVTHSEGSFYRDDSFKSDSDFDFSNRESLSVPSFMVQSSTLSLTTDSDICGGTIKENKSSDNENSHIEVRKLDVCADSNIGVSENTEMEYLNDSKNIKTVSNEETLKMNLTAKESSVSHSENVASLEFNENVVQSSDAVLEANICPGNNYKAESVLKSHESIFDEDTRSNPDIKDNENIAFTREENSCDANQDLEFSIVRNTGVPMDISVGVVTTEDARNVYEDISIASYGEHDLNIPLLSDISRSQSDNQNEDDAARDSGHLGLDISSTVMAQGETRNVGDTSVVDAAENATSSESSGSIYHYDSLERTEDFQDPERNEKSNVRDKDVNMSNNVEVIEIHDSSEGSTNNSSLNGSCYSNFLAENIYGYEEKNIFESDIEISSGSSSSSNSELDDTEYGDEEKNTEQLNGNVHEVLDDSSEAASGKSNDKELEEDDDKQVEEDQDKQLEEDQDKQLEEEQHKNVVAVNDSENKNISFEDSYPAAESIKDVNRVVNDNEIIPAVIPEDGIEGNQQNVQSSSTETETNKESDPLIVMNVPKNLFSHVKSTVDNSSQKPIEDLVCTVVVEDSTLCKTDIIDNWSAEDEQLDITRIDILDATPVQESDSISQPDVSNLTDQSNASYLSASAFVEDKTLYKTHFLDKCEIDSTHLEISSVDILDNTVLIQSNEAPSILDERAQQRLDTLGLGADKTADNLKSELKNETYKQSQCPEKNREHPSTAAMIVDVTDAVKAKGPADADKILNTAIKSENLGGYCLRKRSGSSSSEVLTSSVKLKPSRKRSASAGRELQDGEVMLSESVDLDKLKHSKSYSKITETVGTVQISTPKRRLRSNSADLRDIGVEKMISPAPKARTRRAMSDSSSVVHDLTDIEVGGAAVKPKIISARRSQRATSVTTLPMISEEMPKAGKTRHKKTELALDDIQSPVNQLDEYSTSRRLTRHQKTMLEKRMDGISHVSSTSEKMDSIKLQDSSTFKAKADMDEYAFAHSSPSSITNSLVGGRTLRRRQSFESATSGASTVPSVSEVETPKKKGSRLRKDSVDSAASNDRQLRSATASPLVTKQEQKKSKKKNVTEDTDASASIDLRRSTRNRSESKSPEKLDVDSASARKSTRRRLISADSEVKSIPEEEVTESSQLTKTRKRKASTHT